MIYGRTYTYRQWWAEHWRPYFAWFPTRLEDGRTAWLCTIERRWFDDKCGNWAGDSSRWLYRERT